MKKGLFIAILAMSIVYSRAELRLENGYEYVDLGLSVKWATCNIGATSPEGYGTYFAWGEVESKANYNWDTYKHSKGSDYAFTKYCSDSEYGYNGFKDSKNILELEDDAASVHWGGSWRIPTDAEWSELRKKCIWKKSRMNGISGYKVTSKTNGNSIFLPFAGFYNYGQLRDVGSSGYSWSSSLCMSAPYNAKYGDFNISSVYGYSTSRRSGLTIRAVCQ